MFYCINKGSHHAIATIEGEAHVISENVCNSLLQKCFLLHQFMYKMQLYVSFIRLSQTTSFKLIFFKSIIQFTIKL